MKSSISRKLLIASSLAVVVPLGAACGGIQRDPISGQQVEERIEFPGWVVKGSGAFGGDTKVFYGVGSASGIRNHGLAWTTAGNRARNELAKVFETYSASLMKDYAASTTAGDFSASSEEQDVVNAIKTFTAQTLHGVEVIDHWIHPVDGTVFALARLDLDAFNGQVDAAKELSQRVKQRVKRNAAKAFADLEAETLRREEIASQ